MIDTATPNPAPGEQPSPPPVPLSSANDPRRKSPLLASFLSVMPGLGQVYVGYYQRGFAHALIVAVLLTVLSSLRNEALIPFIGLFMAFFWLHNIIDAGRRASLFNEVIAGRSSVQLPDEMELRLPNMRGSVAGGVSIMAFGAVLLSNTLFNFSLAWVEDWWPAAFILFGGYLVYKARTEEEVI